MKLMAGDPNGKKAKKALELEVGCMIPCCRSALPGPRYHKFQEYGLAMDNGAFGCHARGVPFDDDMFLKFVDAANKHKLEMMFVVCPDKIAGGLDSLDFSEAWRPRIQYPRIAFVVQDGMHGDHIEGIIDHYDYLFVGGTVEWKWMTAAYWIKWAHDHGKPCHIGQCGQKWMIYAADRLGADSIDSSSWTQNNSFAIIEEYRECLQMEMDFGHKWPMKEPWRGEKTPDLRWMAPRKEKGCSLARKLALAARAKDD